MKKNRVILKHLKNRRGSTLLEALIALAAIVIVLAATSTLVINSLDNSTFAKNQNQAAKLVQEGMEYIRGQIQNDASYEQYRSYGSLRCMGDIANQGGVFTPGPCSTANINGVFKREVLFQESADCIPPSGGTGLKATVSVYWQSGKCTLSNPFCHKQESVSCFSDPSSKRQVGI